MTRNEQTLVDALRNLGAAIERGDPQEIADVWLGQGKRAIKDVEHGK